MSEFNTLPFGDFWCVVFAPGGQVRGLCSICTSEAVADEVARRIDAANALVRVSRASPDSPPHMIPCVIFEVSEPGGSVVLDWFASQVFTNAEPKRLSNPANYHPLLDASVLPPGSKSYPRSVSDLQALLSP